MRPLQLLLDNLQGPSRLIQKRHDKQLDLQASNQKSEKNRDPTKTKSVNIAEFYYNESYKKIFQP